MALLWRPLPEHCLSTLATFLFGIAHNPGVDISYQATYNCFLGSARRGLTAQKCLETRKDTLLLVALIM
jgi:hypothetical protein